MMDLAEIKESRTAEYPKHSDEEMLDWLIAEVERLSKSQCPHGACDSLKGEIGELRRRAEKAEAERDRYKAALVQIIDDYDPDYQGERSLAMTADLALKGDYAIRALPIKKAALSAKEGKRWISASD
jgi:hypothetical protein